MQIKTDDVRTFLSDYGYYRVMDYPVLDVPFQWSTWTNGIVDVDFDEDTEFLYLELLGTWWSGQDGGSALLAQLVEWATLRSLLIE